MKISITIGPLMSDRLNEILRTGFYGRTRAETARNLLYRAVENLIASGIIEKHKWNRSPTKKR